jgi:hypothetical protein
MGPDRRLSAPCPTSSDALLKESCKCRLLWDIDGRRAPTISFVVDDGSSSDSIRPATYADEHQRTSREWDVQSVGEGLMCNVNAEDSQQRLSGLPGKAGRIPTAWARPSTIAD